MTERHSGPAAGPVLFDVQATQSAGHRDRGVARYTAELATALWNGHRGLMHSFLLNPDLAPPGAVVVSLPDDGRGSGFQCPMLRAAVALLTKEDASREGCFKNFNLNICG